MGHLAIFTVMKRKMVLKSDYSHGYEAFPNLQQLNQNIIYIKFVQKK